MNSPRHKSDYLLEILNQYDIQGILRKLNISWPEHKVNSNGWVVMSSPFRDDLNPTFSLKPKNRLL